MEDVVALGMRDAEGDPSYRQGPVPPELKVLELPHPHAPTSTGRAAELPRCRGSDGPGLATAPPWEGE